MNSTVPAPEPSSPRLFVPVRRSRYAVTLRPFVDPLGTRTGVGFTSPQKLRAVLGETQEYLEVGERALRSMLRAAGTENVCIDPRLTAAAPGETAVTPQAHPVAAMPRPRLRLEGFAA